MMARPPKAGTNESRRAGLAQNLTAITIIPPAPTITPMTYGSPNTLTPSPSSRPLATPATAHATAITGMFDA